MLVYNFSAFKNQTRKIRKLQRRVLKCFHKIHKHVLIIINVILAIFGISSFTIGMIWRTNERKYCDILPLPPISPGLASIIFGILIITAAICGLISILRRNPYFLFLNSILLITICVIEFIYGIIAFIIIEISPDYIASLEDALQETFKPEIKPSAEFFDEIQKEYQCCGVVGYNDYPNNKIPASCCPDQKKDNENFYKIGCALAIGNYNENEYSIMGRFSIIFSIIASIGTFFICIARGFSEESPAVAPTSPHSGGQELNFELAKEKIK